MVSDKKKIMKKNNCRSILHNFRYEKNKNTKKLHQIFIKLNYSFFLINLFYLLNKFYLFVKL